MPIATSPLLKRVLQTSPDITNPLLKGVLQTSPDIPTTLPAQFNRDSTPLSEYFDKLITGIPATRPAQSQFNIDELIQQNLNNPYAQRAGEWFNRVLSPDYQAYSPEYKKQLYDTRAKGLIEDVFRPQEERFAARLATSGLSGSGVAADMWANEVMTNQNRMLADLLTEIEQENINLTRADQLQALSMFPALNPLNDLFTYKGLLSQDEAMRLQAEALRQQAEAAKRAAKAEESKGFGSFLGSIADAILNIIF